MKHQLSRFNTVLLYIISVISIGLIVYTVNKGATDDEIAYVDISKLVDGYKFKKDLEGISEQNLLKIKNVSDSLKMIKKISGNASLLVDSQIIYVEQAFNEYYIKTNQDISKKIWERLNPAIEQYGKDKKVELIIGANGTGTILYGSKQRDITNDLLKYLNEKYETGN